MTEAEEDKKFNTVPTKLGWLVLVVNMIVGAGTFVVSAFLGTQFMESWGYFITLFCAAILFGMTFGKDNLLVRPYEPPAIVDPDAAWRQTMELEHEFGLPHYAETLALCPWPQCFPKSWEDVPVGDILKTAEMQIDAGMDDSNEIRAVNKIQALATADEAQKRKKEILSENDVRRLENGARSSLRAHAQRKHDERVRKELYEEALEGLRKHGMSFLPTGVEVNTIYNDEGIVRYIFHDKLGFTPLEQLDALHQAANTLLNERRQQRIHLEQINRQLELQAREYSIEEHKIADTKVSGILTPETEKDTA